LRSALSSRFGAALLLSAITRIFDFDPNVLRTGAAILLLGFGLLMIWPAPFEWLSIRSAASPTAAPPATPRSDKQYRWLRARHHARSGLDALCRPRARFDPHRGRDIERRRMGSTLLVVYAIGAAIPMLAIAYGGQASPPAFAASRESHPGCSRDLALVVIAFAVASYFQYDTLIVAWLTGFYPNGRSACNQPLA